MKQFEPFYSATDAFALPTRYDPFPNAALEALAGGLPLLVSTTCATAETLPIEAMSERLRALYRQTGAPAHCS